jgi:hypothetical protein
MALGAMIAAEAKFNRALHNLQTLNNKAELFLSDPKPWRIPVEFEPDTGWHVARLQIIEEPGPELGVLVGDIAYQLLSALHQVAWELVVRKLGKKRAECVKRRIDFPLAQKEADFRSTYKVLLQSVSGRAVTRLERAQPYNRMNDPSIPVCAHPLALMKDVADTDKHRVVPAGFGMINFSGVRFAWEPAASSDPTVEPVELDRRNSLRRVGNLKDGARLMRIRFARGNAEANVRVEGDPPLLIAFKGSSWAFTLYDIGAWLAQVGDILTDFAPLFPSQRTQFSRR